LSFGTRAAGAWTGGLWPHTLSGYNGEIVSVYNNVDAKIDIDLRPTNKGESLSSIKRDICEPSSQAGETPPKVLDCRITTINGRQWVWALYQHVCDCEQAPPDRIISTIAGGHVYDAAAYGRSPQLKSILLSFVVLDGLANTGIDVRWLFGLGAIMLIVGAAMFMTRRAT
jgi:hypothetical protein